MIKNLPSFLNIIVLLYVEIWREGLVLAGMSLKEQYATDIENFCPGSLHLSTPLALMLWSLKDQRSWRVVTRWHLDIMLSDALYLDFSRPNKHCDRLSKTFFKL